jgi:hypothetical protein
MRVTSLERSPRFMKTLRRFSLVLPMILAWPACTGLAGTAPGGAALAVGFGGATLAVGFGGATLAVGFSGATLAGAGESPAGPFRPPAVPLVTHDPYFSIWSPADRLTDAWPTHWTGKRHSLSSMVRVDGKAFRLMGPEPAEAAPMPQVGLDVFPTRTIYRFLGEGVELTLTFLTPALPRDLDVLSRPVTYIVWEARSADGKGHDVSAYFDAAGEIAVNDPAQLVAWSRENVPGLSVLRVGSKDQRILAKKGDDLRIDWGYLYAAAPVGGSARCAAAPGPQARAAFASGEDLPERDDERMPRPANDGLPVLAFILGFGQVGEAPVSRHILLAYDDLYSIKFMGERLRPYWRRKGAEPADLLASAESEYADLARKCRSFDEELFADLVRAGGEKYARLVSLAHRQTLAGNKLAADSKGQPLFFPKENFSNGCIATVDVIYPMAPLFLLFGPTLAKATLVPVLEYSISDRWKFPFAPHDLGTYPHATGQVYGGGERTEENQMPVEESGNFLILLGAVALMDGNADFAAKYWKSVTRWAEYLKEKGLDPENQLCTDDFAGHLAHNVNLSAKAILGLRAYALLCEMKGVKDDAKAYLETSRDFARKWVETAADGDHYRLAFDKPGTWSQKYNLVWDRVLGFHLFPPEVARKELDFYRKTQNRYGLPLDNRKPFTKLDWITWTATLTGSREDFDALISPAVDFLCESPDRVPMTDWYFTQSGKVAGFRARPVVGGVFIKLLDDSGIWKKWAARGPKATGEWAPLPEGPRVIDIVPASRRSAVPWRYTFQKPADGWQKPDFDDSAWKEGPAGFGARGTPGARARTAWTTPEIWIRRSFELESLPAGDFQLLLHHDEDARVYINGVLAAEESGFTTDYEPVAIMPDARAALQRGRNVLAAHCRQTTGGQYIDVGIVQTIPAR